MAELSEAINLDEIAVGLPRRIHEVTARQVAKARDRIALVEDGASWSYRDLDQRVGEIATVLSSLGIRPGDRMIIVSENCSSPPCCWRRAGSMPGRSSPTRDCPHANWTRSATIAAPAGCSSRQVFRKRLRRTHRAMARRSVK